MRVPVLGLITSTVACVTVFLGAACPDSGNASSPAATPSDYRILGSAPLCEASGAVRSPWDENTILIADNEIGDALFEFSIGQISLHSQTVIPLPPAFDVGDIEALAICNDQLVVIGSHGRKGGVAITAKRQRIRVLSWSNDANQRLSAGTDLDDHSIWTRATADLDSCVEALFTTPAPDVARDFCASLLSSEAEADNRGFGSLDIEGATGVRDPETGLDRLWIGLRQPRFAGAAPLLRLVPGEQEFRFDQLVLIGFNRGIRALASDQHFLWAILGPAAPDYSTSCLWRAPLGGLRPGATLRGEIVADGLAPSSEAIVLLEDRIIIMTDGDEPEKRGEPCEEVSRYLFLPR